MEGHLISGRREYPYEYCIVRLHSILRVKRAYLAYVQ